MHTRFFILLTLGTVLVATGTAGAQDVRPLSISSGTKHTGSDRGSVPQPQCDRYLFASDVRPTNDRGHLEAITTCFQALKTQLEEAADKPTSANLNQKIIRMRVSYKRLKKWIPDHPPAAGPSSPENGSSTSAETSDSNGAYTNGRFSGTPSGPEPVPEYWANLRLAEDQVGDQLRTTLKKHDLFATFSAVLVTGATLADAGQPESEDASMATSSDGAKTTQGASQDAQAVGTILWQTRHFGDESIRVLDLSIGGRIGLQPILNLVTATPPEEAPPDTPPVVGAVHQNAFVWTLGAQLHKPIRGINSEIGWYGSTGSSTLSSVPKAVDKGAGSFVAFPLDYGAQQTAWLWEAGVTFDMFDNPLEQIHAEKGTLAPQFQAVVALRRDDRFRGGVFDGYDNPTARLLFRLTLDAIQVFDRRQFGEASKPFTFGFVVEHERSASWGDGPRVPSATRFILRGDINLLKALSGAPNEDPRNEL